MPTTSMKSAAKHLKAACEGGNEKEILKCCGAVAYCCDKDCGEDGCPTEEINGCVAALQQCQQEGNKPNGIMKAGSFAPILSAAIQMALQLLQMYLQQNNQEAGK